jgi:hypothetical protein
MTVRIRFEDVGRDRRTWEQEFTTDGDGDLSGPALIGAIRKRGGVVSRDVDFLAGDDGDMTIVVGGFRPVGKWRIVDPSVEA